MEIVKYNYKKEDAQQSLWFIGDLEKKSPLVDTTC